MRLFIVVTFIFILFLTAFADAQPARNPVALSPLIGDTLNRAQREYYQLLPKLDDVQWAVFYLNPDSTLRVHVNLKKDTGTSDTVIERYSRLNVIRNQIAQVGMVRRQSGDERAPVDKYLMKDGSVIQGRTLKYGKDTVVVATANLGTIAIRKVDIEETGISGERAKETYGKYGMVDKNQSRTFLLPTASTLDAGGGYVADYELFLFTVAFALGDRLMLNGGFVLLPIPMEEQILNFGLKLKLFEVENNSCAVGAQFLSLPGVDVGSFGAGFAIVSHGDADKKINAAIGTGFNTKTGASTNLLFALSGDSRISESVKLMFEAYYLGYNVVPLIVGLRFFGKNISGDLGLCYLIGSDIGSPIGIPIMNIVYSF